MIFFIYLKFFFKLFISNQICTKFGMTNIFWETHLSHLSQRATAHTYIFVYPLLVN